MTTATVTANDVSMRTDDMPCCRLSNPSFFSYTCRYWLHDSRQRLTTICLIFLCCLPPSSQFVIYQGTTQKLDNRDLSMLRGMKIEDRRTVYEFCRMVVVFPDMLREKMSDDALSRSKPICEQLLLGIKKVKELEARSKSQHTHQHTSSKIL